MVQFDQQYVLLIPFVLNLPTMNNETTICNLHNNITMILNHLLQTAVLGCVLLLAPSFSNAKRLPSGLLPQPIPSDLIAIHDAVIAAEFGPSELLSKACLSRRHALELLIDSQRFQDAFEFSVALHEIYKDEESLDPFEADLMCASDAPFVGTGTILTEVMSTRQTNLRDGTK